MLLLASLLNYLRKQVKQYTTPYGNCRFEDIEGTVKQANPPLNWRMYFLLIRVGEGRLLYKQWMELSKPF